MNKYVLMIWGLLALLLGGSIAMFLIGQPLSGGILMGFFMANLVRYIAEEIAYKKKAKIELQIEYENVCRHWAEEFGVDLRTGEKIQEDKWQ